MIEDPIDMWTPTQSNPTKSKGIKVDKNLTASQMKYTEMMRMRWVRLLTSVDDQNFDSAVGWEEMG